MRVNLAMLPDKFLPESDGQVNPVKGLQGFGTPRDLQGVGAVGEAAGSDQFLPDGVQFSPGVGLVLDQVEEGMPHRQSRDRNRVDEEQG